MDHTEVVARVLADIGADPFEAYEMIRRLNARGFDVVAIGDMGR